MIIELHHPTDPRFLLVTDPPEQVVYDDLIDWKYGKALLFAPGPVDLVYRQPGGPATPWMRPEAS